MKGCVEAVTLSSDVAGCQVADSVIATMVAFLIDSAKKHAPHDLRVESSAATVHSWKI
jgi:hypothetical protein